MNLKARYNLWKLKRSSSPSLAFKSSLRKELDAAWDAKHGHLPWYQLIAVHKVGAFAVVVLLLATSGGAYAYSSAEVTAGTALYTVKEAIEKVEEVTKVTPEAKAKFYLKKIERREAEREVIKKNILVPEVKTEVEVMATEEASVGARKADIKTEVRLDAKAKIKLKAAERKIKRTERSIEKAEEQLEKNNIIFEKAESKDVKLRQEVKDRLDKRLEKIKEQKQQMEIRLDLKDKKNLERKDKQEDSVDEDSEQENKNPTRIEIRSRIKGIFN